MQFCWMYKLWRKKCQPQILGQKFVSSHHTFFLNTCQFKKFKSKYFSSTMEIWFLKIYVFALKVLWHLIGGKFEIFQQLNSYSGLFSWTSPAIIGRYTGMYGVEQGCYCCTQIIVRCFRLLRMYSVLEVRFPSILTAMKY